MSDELLLQASLDTEPSDSAARMLLSEWLAERGDWRAFGYAWMARHHKRPLLNLLMWRWWTIGMRGTPSAIADDLDPAMEGYVEKEGSRSFSYRTRLEAELAVCRALVKVAH